MSRSLKGFLLFTDVGFLVYWLATGAHWIPPQWAYSDSANPLMVTWNWSFFPLDLAASVLGLTGFLLWKGSAAGRSLVLLSLVLTSSSGLNALAFWTIQGQFEPPWWAANAFLLVWPLPYLVRLVRA